VSEPLIGRSGATAPSSPWRRRPGKRASWPSSRLRQTAVHQLPLEHVLLLGTPFTAERLRPVVERRGVVATEAHRDQIVVLEERGQGPVGALGLAEKPLPVDGVFVLEEFLQHECGYSRRYELGGPKCSAADPRDRCWLRYCCHRPHQGGDPADDGPAASKVHKADPWATVMASDHGND